jgi:hypothetical protein
MGEYQTLISHTPITRKIQDLRLEQTSYLTVFTAHLKPEAETAGATMSCGPDRHPLRPCTIHVTHRHCIRDRFATSRARCAGDGRQRTRKQMSSRTCVAVYGVEVVGNHIFWTRELIGSEGARLISATPTLTFSANSSETRHRPN